MENFVTAEKDGIEDLIPINVWNKMGGSSNKYGWKMIAQTPPEVQELAKKRTVELKHLKPEGEVIDEVVEVKARRGPKAK